MAEKEIETVCPTSQQHWREWLQEHHAEKQSVWLIYHKKKAGSPTVTWSEAVDEALCFGWIDSRAKPMDDERYMQFFSRRKPNSGWSKINKEKVQQLIAGGLMTQAGVNAIETAKQNGSWAILDDVEALIIPADLAGAFQNRPNAERFFLDLSQSDRRNLLQWLAVAKRSETRQRRIAEIVERAGQRLKPTAIHWTKKRPVVGEK
ncbi:YdeI/OmpD-associated family protein [Spirosoma arcticum]